MSPIVPYKKLTDIEESTQEYSKRPLLNKDTRKLTDSDIVNLLIYDLYISERLNISGLSPKYKGILEAVSKLSDEIGLRKCAVNRLITSNRSSEKRIKLNEYRKAHYNLAPFCITFNNDKPANVKKEDEHKIWGDGSDIYPENELIGFIADTIAGLRLNGKSVYDIGIPGYTWSEDTTGKIIMERKKGDSDKDDNDKYGDEVKMSGFIDEVGELKWCEVGAAPAAPAAAAVAAAPAAVAVAAPAPAAAADEETEIKKATDAAEIQKAIDIISKAHTGSMSICQFPVALLTKRTDNDIIRIWRNSREICLHNLIDKLQPSPRGLANGLRSTSQLQSSPGKALIKQLRTDRESTENKGQNKLDESEKLLKDNKKLYDPEIYLKILRGQGGGRRTRKRRAIPKNKTHKGVLHSGRYTPRRKRSALRKTQKKYSSTK